MTQRHCNQWELQFTAPDLNLDETVVLTVPALLPQKTIRAVRHRLLANRTYIQSGGTPKNEYLLSGRVFCAGCGYSMFGQTNHGKVISILLLLRAPEGPRTSSPFITLELL